jgi:hypothetical protein
MTFSSFAREFACHYLLDEEVIIASCLPLTTGDDESSEGEIAYDILSVAGIRVDEDGQEPLRGKLRRCT